MSPPAFFAFMQTDSLLLGKVYSAYEDLIVCFKLQADWKKIRKAALWKREKVLGNVRNYMLLVVHTLRSKDHRQVHTVEQSCSGTGVLPVPSTQKTVRLSQSHEIVIKLHVFFRQWCTVVICFLVFELLWVVFSQFSLQPQRFLCFLHESCSFLLASLRRKWSVCSLLEN